MGQNMLAFIYVENRNPGALLKRWNVVSARKKKKLEHRPIWLLLFNLNTDKER